MKVIFVIGLAATNKPIGLYLKSCDFNAFGGYGHAELTAHVPNAMKFPDVSTAWEFWKTQSELTPFRQDGKPNRPLTAYHVTIMDDPEA